ncbi:MAG TPA: hypothetical protein VMJ32_18440 [Pirellulales bacterium]|nr:hypothetical protein [Pirellulales bacterium]
MATTEHLKTELETYENNRQKLMVNGVGRYVLIQGSSILGIWSSYEDALKAGYEKCGVDGKFLVKQIQGPVDGIQFFTRDFACPV